MIKQAIVLLLLAASNYSSGQQAILVIDFKVVEARKSSLADSTSSAENLSLVILTPSEEQLAVKLASLASNSSTLHTSPNVGTRRARTASVSSTDEPTSKKNRPRLMLQSIEGGYLFKKDDQYYVKADSGTCYKLNESACKGLKKALSSLTGKKITFNETHQAIGILPTSGPEAKTNRTYYCACGLKLHGIGDHHTKICGKTFQAIDPASIITR